MALLRAITERLVRRPGLAVTVALLSSVAMLFWSAQLFGDLRADAKELLPATARSVRTLNDLERRFGGWSQLSVVVESPSREANRRFSDDLVREASKLESVRSIRNKLGEEAGFFHARRHLFVDLEDLHRIKERLEDAVTTAKARASPLFVDLEPDATDPAGDPKPIEIDLSDILSKYTSDLSLEKRFPEAYFESPDGTSLAVIVRQRGFAFGIEKNRELVRGVERAISALDPSHYHPEMVVGLGGDVKNLIDEQVSLVEDLTLASVVVALLLAVVVLGYFRRFRSLLLVTVPLFVGCTWTFGLSHFLVGYLNASSAFLGPIVAGNGINFGLILLARYLEERRCGHGPEDGLRRAVEETRPATALAALAASIAYGSLVVTDFLGFKHFGVIGGIGMVLCWIATFVVLPPLILVLERIAPFDPKRDRFELYRRGALAALPARAVLSAPRGLAIGGAASGVLALAIAALFLRDPFEKDFHRLRSTAAEESGAAHWEAKVDTIFGQYLSPQVIVAERAEDVPHIVRHLKGRIAEEGALSPITSVTALFTLVPDRQAEKIEVLEEIRALLDDRLLAHLDEANRQEAIEHRPAADLVPFTALDLPESVRADFREIDGTEGLVVLALPNLALNLYHADEMRRVSDLLREIPLPGGRTVHSSGNFVVYTDMVDAVATDGPKATAYSFAGVLLLAALLLRRARRVLLVVTPLLLGVAWLCGLLALFDLKINFLNFIALPITFGIGIDYAVNIFGRYAVERGRAPPSEAVGHALASTGGAVVLCSLTTVIGYGSLLLARNGALISFGKVAILGELTCLAAALLIMPAWIVCSERVSAGPKAET